MAEGDQPSVVASVNSSQIRQLRPAEAAASLRIRLFGPVEVAVNGRPVHIPSKRARGLLGYLAIREGAEVSRNVLTGLFWGERSEAQARASLRQALSELRGALADLAAASIIASREAVTFLAGSAWIDARLVEAVANSEDDDALRTASELIGGELIEGLAMGEAGFEQWLQTERERFRLLACKIHLRLMGRAEQDGRLEQALTYGLKLLSLDPLQEHVHRALMRIYAAQRRYDAALAQYERCRRDLESQLAVRPEPETDDLARSIRANRHDRPSDAVAARPAAVAHATPPALPNRPSIAVLPFTRIGGDPDSGCFAGGVADDIITELSRDKDLFVVARHSSFRIAQEEQDPAAIGRALGVRYLLAGSVRRAGERLRLSLHLIQCENGSEAWAERYDRGLEDLFDVQLEVARIVTSTIASWSSSASAVSPTLITSARLSSDMSQNQS